MTELNENKNKVYEKQNIVFYNSENVDSFASAMISSIYLADSALYIPITHKFPYGIYSSFDDLICSIVDKDIYFLGCSLSLNEHLKLRDIANDVLIIGHNEESRRHLETIPGAIFMQRSSSCVITWEFFMNSEPPKMLKLIESNELHIDNTDEIKHFMYGLKELKEDFNLWTTYLDDKNVIQLIVAGKIIEKYMKGQVDKIKVNGKENLFENKKTIVVNGDKIFLNEIYFHYKLHTNYDCLLYWHKNKDDLIYCFLRICNENINIDELLNLSNGIVNNDKSAFFYFKNIEDFNNILAYDLKF